ncbi:MAG: glutathione S-transferase family protein [Candidatus Thiodiazotropha sp. (ex. Lucinoma kazani)]
MNIKLVSFALCPFVQRSVILLKKKQIKYQLEYIDLEQPPEWFKRLSPMGKVPLMLVDGEVLFESSVILDFLDESHSPRFHPKDNLTRAQHKAWIEFGSSLLMVQHGMAMAADRKALAEKKQQLENDLQQLVLPLEQQLFGDPDHFTLVDAAYAPLFMRLDLYAGFHQAAKVIYPKPIADWAERLISLPSVRESVVDDFSERLRQFLNKGGAWLVKG